MLWNPYANVHLDVFDEEIRNLVEGRTSQKTRDDDDARNLKSNWYLQQKRPQLNHI